jgi:hypothetical protein
MHTVDYIPLLFVGTVFFYLTFKMMARYLQARAL